MHKNGKTRNELIDECIERGLPAMENDTIETLKIMLQLDEQKQNEMPDDDLLEDDEFFE